MPKKSPASLPLVSTRLTASVSVAMVLLLLGLAALAGIAAHNIATEIRQNMGFVVVFSDDARPDDIEAMKKRFTAADYVVSYAYSSPEMVLERWQQMIGDDEQINDLLDVNPFAPEIEVHVKAAYVSADSLEVIAAPLEMVPGVAEIKMHTDVVDSVNATMRNVAVALAAIAVALLLIAIVLINNTVRLTVYSRRFSIYTMKLVGATPGFIRSPIVTANAIAGLIAGLAAAALLAAILAYVGRIDPSPANCVSWTQSVWVLGAMPLAGVVICLPAALFAANKYIRISHDKIYR